MNNSQKNINYKLKSVDVANFITDGFLFYENIVSSNLCKKVISEIKEGLFNEYQKVGTKFYDKHWNGLAIGEVFNLKIVRNVIESLLGKDPVYDHHYVHIKGKKTKDKENLHQDGDEDKRKYQFDLLVLFFPHDITSNMGGTLIVPSSHYRKVNGNSIKRYQHVVGEKQITCKAGTIMFLHHNLWHSGRSNNSNNERILFKLRLNPSGDQKKCWNSKNTDMNEIISIISKDYFWHGDQKRQEIINRIKLWRYLYDDNTSDFEKKHLWGTKLSNINKVIYQDSVRSVDKND